jgi:branched-chain amino acid aminotransferase
VLGLVNNDWKSLDETAMLKAINTNLYTSASNMVKQNGWNDLLLVNNGFISESGTANLFIVKGNIVFTPPISEGCIAGVMRSFILSKLNEMKIQVHECPVSVEMLMNADEVFLTNAVRRIKWIKEIENKIFSTNKFSNSLSNKLFNN